MVDVTENNRHQNQGIGDDVGDAFNPGALPTFTFLNQPTRCSALFYPAKNMCPQRGDHIEHRI